MSSIIPYPIPLKGDPIPGWVNRPAYLATCLPTIQKCMPKEWMTPEALERMMASLRMTAEAKEKRQEKAEERMEREEERLKRRDEKKALN